MYFIKIRFINFGNSNFIIAPCFSNVFRFYTDFWLLGLFFLDSIQRYQAFSSFLLSSSTFFSQNTIFKIDYLSCDSFFFHLFLVKLFSSCNYMGGSHLLPHSLPKLVFTKFVLFRKISDNFYNHVKIGTPKKEHKFTSHE